MPMSDSSHCNRSIPTHTHKSKDLLKQPTPRSTTFAIHQMGERETEPCSQIWISVFWIQCSCRLDCRKKPLTSFWNLNIVFFKLPLSSSSNQIWWDESHLMETFRSDDTTLSRLYQLRNGIKLGAVVVKRDAVRSSVPKATWMVNWPTNPFYYSF